MVRTQLGVGEDQGLFAVTYMVYACTFPDPCADPKSSSTSRFHNLRYNLHHRTGVSESRIGGSTFSNSRRLGFSGDSIRFVTLAKFRTTAPQVQVRAPPKVLET